MKLQASKTLPRSFYSGKATEVAPLLLNKLLNYNGVIGRIVEVEAYCGADDPASHAFRGMTQRNATMFGKPGLLYVYFTYGMHFCANVVCGAEGIASAVLLRALEPVAGIDEMRDRRQTSDKHLTSGPAKLSKALEIDKILDGADLVTGNRGITIEYDGATPPMEVGIGGRVGIRQATERQWRWWVAGNPYVSKGKAAGPT